MASGAELDLEWHGGAPGAKSDFVAVALSGVGYDGGDPKVSADWWVKISEAWLKPMLAQ